MKQLQFKRLVIRAMWQLTTDVHNVGERYLIPRRMVERLAPGREGGFYTLTFTRFARKGSKRIMPYTSRGDYLINRGPSGMRYEGVLTQWLRDQLSAAGIYPSKYLFLTLEKEN